MLNIGSSSNIQGLEKTFCKRGHIAHCLAARDMHEIVKYDYWGKRVQRGIVEIATKNCNFLARFRCDRGWVEELVFI